MAKRKRRAFTTEFKAQTVRLVRESGKSVGAVARELILRRLAPPSRFALRLASLHLNRL